MTSNCEFIKEALSEANLDEIIFLDNQYLEIVDCATSKQLSYSFDFKKKKLKNFKKFYSQKIYLNI